MFFNASLAVAEAITTTLADPSDERKTRLEDALPDPEDASRVVQLTPTAGRVALQKLRPQVSASLDLARARGKAPSGPGEPSRFPGDPPLYVGSGAHAADVALLQRLEIKAVLNTAPVSYTHLTLPTTPYV